MSTPTRRCREYSVQQVPNSKVQRYILKEQREQQIESKSHEVEDWRFEGQEKELFLKIYIYILCYTGMNMTRQTQSWRIPDPQGVLGSRPAG